MKSSSLITTNETCDGNLISNSPLQPGSIPIAVFSLVTVTVGIGCYAIPIELHKMSFLTGIIVVLVGGLLNYFTLTSIYRASLVQNEKEYGQLTSKTLGHAWGLFLDFSIVLYVGGVLIIQSIIIYSSIGRLVYQFGYSTDENNFDDFNKDFWNKLNATNLIINYGLAFFVYIPLSLTENFTKFRFLSMLNVFSIFYNVIVLFLEAPFYFAALSAEGFDWQTTNWFNFEIGFQANLEFFQGFCVIMLAYNCHNSLLIILNELAVPSEQNLNKMVSTSVLIDTIVYALVGVAGFVTVADDTSCGLAVLRKDKLLNPDYFNLFTLFLLVANTIFGFAANYLSLRVTIFARCFGTKEIDTKRNRILTVSIILIAVTIGVLKSEILIFMSIFGGYFASLIMFFFPSYSLKSNTVCED